MRAVGAVCFLRLRAIALARAYSPPCITARRGITHQRNSFTSSQIAATVRVAWLRDEVFISLCIGDYVVAPSPRSLPNNTFLRARNSQDQPRPAHSACIDSRACRDRRF